MKEGGIKIGMGCFTIPFALRVLPIALFLVILPFFMVKTVWLYLTEGKIANAIFTLVCTCLLLCAYYGAFVLLRKFMGKGKRAKNAKPSSRERKVGVCRSSFAWAVHRERFCRGGL